MVPKPASQSHHAIFHIVRLSTTTTARTFCVTSSQAESVEVRGTPQQCDYSLNLVTMSVIEGHDIVLRGMIIGVNSRLHCLWSPTTTNRAREILATNFIEDI